jgi:hypothetical protein
MVLEFDTWFWVDLTLMKTHVSELRALFDT